MNSSYIERHRGGYRIAGTRVSLDSVVYSFLQGQTAESIAQSFPSDARRKLQHTRSCINIRKNDLQ